MLNVDVVKGCDLNCASSVAFILKFSDKNNNSRLLARPNFFLPVLPEQFQKLLAFLLPIFGNVDGSWRVTSKLRDSTLIQAKLHEDARRCSKDFQQVWYELEMFKVCRDNMPCEVKKNNILVWCGVVYVSVLWRPQ
jgi:hypothetical protein